MKTLSFKQKPLIFLSNVIKTAPIDRVSNRGRKLKFFEDSYLLIYSWARNHGEEPCYVQRRVSKAFHRIEDRLNPPVHDAILKGFVCAQRQVQEAPSRGNNALRRKDNSYEVKTENIE